MKANPNRKKIIEAYQVPGGNVSPDIFNLPCVRSAHKEKDGSAFYLCDVYLDSKDYARENDYIFKLEDGSWWVLSAEEYHEYNLNG